MAARSGFTLVELLVALVILTAAVIGIGTATGSYARVVSLVDRRTLAAQIAEDRLEVIRTDPNFDGLADRYTESATPLADPPGFTRSTVFMTRRDTTQTGVVHFVRVTVTVDGPGLREPVARTISRGSP